jgi:hypothetical protein
MSNFNKVLSALTGVRKVGNSGYRAFCPNHQPAPHRPGRSPSLSVKQSNDNSDLILIKCHAGCGYTEIRDAAGLTDADLLPARPHSHNVKPARDWLSAAALADEVAEKAIMVLVGAQVDVFDLMAVRDQFKAAARRAMAGGSK